MSAAAAPRHAPSTALDTEGARLLANTRSWIRTHLRRGRMAARVHSSATPSWTNQCRHVLQNLATALQESPMDETKVATHVSVLWLLPAAVFSLPGGSRGGTRGRHNRYNRIHRALEDRDLAAKLFAWVASGAPQTASATAAPADVAAAAHASHDSTMSTDSDSSSSDSDTVMPDSDSDCAGTGQSDVTSEPRSSTERIAQRVESHFRAGHISRALRSLTATSTKANTQLATERDLLKQLHPACPSTLPLCPADAPEVVVDPEWMVSEMAASDTGAAPGPSGWSSNMLSVLAQDTHCVTALSLIIQCIVNNKMPPAVRLLLTTSSLVSLVKDDYGGRRPLAVGEMLYRLAARYALFSVLGGAQKALRPHQYGIGEQDGCTHVVQSLQHLLTLPPVAPPPERPRHEFASASLRPPPPPVDSAARSLACLSLGLSSK